LPSPTPIESGVGQPAVTASMSRGDRGDNVGGQSALAVQDTSGLSSGTQARADRRGLLSAALVGCGIGLALGAIYLSVGLARAGVDHSRAARIARAADGGFSEAMLQREISHMEPGALRLARAYDALAGDAGRDPAQAWPSRFDDRQAIGHRVTALESVRQLDCLTQAVYYEARGETPRGQAAVAQVVMNRVNNPSFPKTICGVVFQGAASQSCQFSFACDGSMARALESDAWDRARIIAERTLSGVVVADIGTATHFHTTSVQPEWGPQMLRVAQVGLHIFYRLNPHAPLANPATDRGALLVSLPLTPSLRLATQMAEKAADATVNAAGIAPVEVREKLVNPSDSARAPPKAAEQPALSEPADAAGS